jgi:hypothetical protein
MRYVTPRVIALSPSLVLAKTPRDRRLRVPSERNLPPRLATAPAPVNTKSMLAVVAMRSPA